MSKRVFALLGFVLLSSGCGEGGPLRRWAGRTVGPPDSLPKLLNDSLPFKYPVALYLQLIDDSVTLQLHVDEFGRPVPESTRIAVPATHTAFDSSALEGSRDLLFRPAMRGGKKVPYTVLFPIQFRIPRVPRLPSDTPATAGAGAKR